MTLNDGCGVLEVSVSVYDASWTQDDYGISKLCSDAAIAAFDAIRTNQPHTEPCEVSIVLADDVFVADLNKKYRDRQGPTNVLSFAGLDGNDLETALDSGLPGGMPLMLGDVIIAHGVVQHEAVEMQIPVNNHLRHLVVHGILHLMGYDHENDDDAREMEGLETSILCNMGLDDPYKSDNNCDVAI
jgi:probable rRNA maturation factor